MLEIEQRKLSKNLNGQNFSHECSIWGHNSSRRSKLNNGSSREIRMVISFHTDVRFGKIIYRDAQNWTTEALDKFEWSRASIVQFRASRYIMSPNRTSVWKLMTIRISRELPLLNFERLDELCPRIEHSCEKLWLFDFLVSFRCSISSVSIYYVPESDICVKSYDHLNFSRGSVD